MYTTEKTLKHIADYPIRAINLLDYRRNPATVDELHQKGYRVIVRDQDGVDKYDFPPFTLDEIVIDEDFSDSSIG